MANKTFVRVTNRDIYEKVEEVISHQIVTNGKVKLNKWIATTALALAILAIGLIFK